MYFLHTHICSRYSGINKSNHRKLTRDIGFNFIIVSLALKLNFALTVTKMSRNGPFLIPPFLIPSNNFQYFLLKFWTFNMTLQIQLVVVKPCSKFHISGHVTWSHTHLTKAVFRLELVRARETFHPDYVGLYWFGISVQKLIDSRGFHWWLILCIQIILIKFSIFRCNLNFI